MENQNMEQNSSPKGVNKYATDNKVDQKDNFVIAFIKQYAKENPKTTFKIMIGLVLLSLCLTATNYIYNNYYYVPSPRMSTSEIISSATNSISQPINATKKALDIKDVMEELEYFRSKTVLTKEDSIRIKYLIDKSKNIEK